MKELTMNEFALPSIDPRDLQLSEILNVPVLQSMMDDFYELTGMGIGIIDLEGNILVKEGWQEICTRFHRCHPETLENCNFSDNELTKNLQVSEFRAYHCKNNLWDISTPVIVEGYHIGNIFLGQFFYDDEVIDYDFFRQQAATHGFDEEAYLAALNKVPRWSHQKVDAAMRFYSKLAVMISKLSTKSMQLKEMVRKKDVLLNYLTDSEEKFQQLVQTMPSAVAIHREGVLVYVNDACVRIMEGSSPANFINKPAIEMVHPDYREMAKERIKKSLKINRIAPLADEIFLSLKGNKINVEVTSMPITFDEKPSMLAIFNDVTERKNNELKIKKLNNELEQKVDERTLELQLINKELESFAYSVSHDLRAPLRGINGWSNAILEDYGDQLDDTAKQYLHRIINDSMHINSLVDELLKLSRVTRSNFICEPVNLSARAEIVISRLKEECAGRDIEFIVQPEMQASGDYPLLDIALDNLFTNACKFTSKQAKAIIEFGKIIQDGKTVYFIKDNGVGFDMEYASKLFGAFQRLHKESEFPGIGIGLATVQRIINRHGGMIWVNAELDNGATFYFTLKEQGMQHE